MNNHRMGYRWAGLSVAMLVISGCASYGIANALPSTAADNVLVDSSNQKALYIFDKDVKNSGKSVCNGDCATKWPPLMAKSSDTNSGNYTIITRDDGSMQWSYKGKPLYFWFKDMKSSDRTGDGVGGVWHVAKP